MWIKILLLFFVFTFLFKTDHSFDQDLGRHLKLGEIIWQTKSIPETNLFSSTNPDFPFINTHWLFEVWVYLINQTIGLSSLLVIKIIILLTAVWLALKTIPKSNYAFLLPIGFIFLHVLRERTELRPEIFSFLFTSVTLFILEKYSSVKQISSDRSTFLPPVKLILFLPLIQLIWINTHIYFFIGLALQIIYLLQFGYKYLHLHQDSGKLKLMAIIFIISSFISLLNPNGFEGLLYPLKVSQNYGYTIVENQTIFFLENIGFKDPNFLFAKVSVIITLLALFLAILKKKFEPKNILLTIFGIGLAALNVRSFPYIIFLALPATLQNFGQLKIRTVNVVLTTIFIILLLIESFYYLNGDYYLYKESDNRVGLKLIENPKGAMDFVIKNNLPGPIYNNFDIGSYIIYRNYPKLKVFVDGRPEAYPKEFFQDIYIPTQYDPQKFEQLDQKIGFNTIIFSHTDQTPWGKAFLSNIVKNENWKTVFLDDFMIVLVKNEVLQEKGLAHIKLLDLNPNQYFFKSHIQPLRLSLFLIQTENFVAAGRFAQYTLSLFPHSPIANMMLGASVENKVFW